MKPQNMNVSRFPGTRKSLKLLAVGVAIFNVSSLVMAATWYDWKDTAPDGNWRQGAGGARWWPGDLWDEPAANNVLKFNNNHYSTSTNNVSGYSVNGIDFGTYATSGHTLTGNDLSFAKADGVNPFIQNEATGTEHTIALNIIGASDASLEFKLLGDIRVTGTINNNGSWIDVFGDSSKMLTLEGVVSGSGGLAINDYSLVKIVNAMTYTGGTEIKEGELWIAEGGSLKGGITVSFADRAADTAKLYISDTNGGTTLTNNITVNSGDADKRVIGALNSAGTNTISGNISQASETVYDVQNSGGTLHVSGQVSGVGGIKKISAGMLLLSASNSFTGNTTINAGVLRAAHNSALGATNGSTTVADGAALELTGDITMAENLTLRGSGIGDAGALLSVSGTNTVTGNITIDSSAPSTTRIGAASGADLVVGKVTTASGKEFWVHGAGNTVVTGQVTSADAFVKFGSGTATLSSSNSMSGNKYLREGVVVLSNNDAFGNSGTTELGWFSGSHNEEAAELRVGNGVNHGGKVAAGYIKSGLTTSVGIMDSSAGEVSGTLDLAYDLTARAGSGSALTLSGLMTNTAGITKAGAGTVILSGASANSYGGATKVNEGTLELAKAANTLAISGSTLSVSSGATLLISQSNQVNDVASVTLSGGTIKRGSGVSETFGNLNLTTASTLDFGSGTEGTLQFGTYTPSSLLTVGNFFKDNVLTFKSDLSSTINNTNHFAFSGAFTTDWDGSTFTITAIPEASTLVAAFGLLALVLWVPCRKLFSVYRTPLICTQRHK